MNPYDTSEEQALRRAIALDGAPEVAETGRRIQAQLAQRLAAKHERRRVSWPVQLLVGAASAALGGLLVASFSQLRHREAPAVRMATGRLLLDNARGGPASLETGQGIPAGAELSAEGEAASFVLGHADVATVSAGSRMRVIAPGVLELRKGRVELAVRSGATVTAGECRLQVAAARFNVERSGGAVFLFVSEGKVRVEHAGQTSEVHANARWSSLPPPRAEADVSLVEQAANLLEAGDVAGARAVYVQLCADPGTNGELGLYYLARLDAGRLKNPARALEALTQLELRYPDGALKREALLSKIEALDALGRHAEARAAAEQFARTFPGSADMQVH
jgi:hypothetical protein